MLLPVQIQAILYHFLMGWIYACGLSFFISFVKHLHFSFMKGFYEICYHLIFTSLMFYGLFKLNKGVSNVYLLGFFILGVIVYISFYQLLFMQFFSGLKNVLRPVKNKLTLAKKRILGIIKLPLRIVKRRYLYAKKRRKNRKNNHQSKKEKASS